LEVVGRPEEVLTPERLRTVFGVKTTTAPGLVIELP
jgi:ABC-type cobalamin/Fe3+-siderophores transport system ATPase subunit